LAETEAVIHRQNGKPKDKPKDLPGVDERPVMQD